MTQRSAWLKHLPGSTLFARLRNWFRSAKISDPIEYEQALLLQPMLLGLAVISLLSLPTSFAVSSTLLEGIRTAVSSSLTVVFASVSLWTLRRNRFRRAVLIMCVGLILEFALILVFEGVRNSGWLLFAFALPITLAGLLTGRPGTIRIVGMSVATVAILGVIQLRTTGLIGLYPRKDDVLPSILSTFVLCGALVGLFFHLFAASLRQALERALSREEELKQIRDNLEVIVADRTAQLETALHTVEERETHLAETNIQLAKAKTVAEEANQMKSRFLANMSHELRTPLNAIINFTAFLERFGEFNERQHELKDRVLANSEHLLGLINDILDLSKIESGRMELIYEPTDLRPILHSVMATAAGLTKDKGLELISELPQELPHVQIDKVRIRQVVLNLISNAVKFTEEGTITLSADVVDDKTLRVAVRDTGIGIAPENQHLVFEEFQQVGHIMNRTQQGTGLGLPISKRLVEMHGGQLTMESVPGQGSIFAFTLPIAAEQAPAAQPVAERTDDAGIAIVVIDDDPDAHETISVMLQGRGYRIHSVLDSRQALATIREIQPQLVITDVQMPHLDGWQVLAALKNDQELA
ncbi:MAG TPA: ATP-binding protein, partial [Herpetosiphonaceae bacterium]